MSNVSFNLVDTSAASGGGTEGEVDTLLYTPLIPGFNYGGATGFLEFGAGAPGSLPFRVDDAGNVTTSGVVAGGTLSNPGPGLAGYGAWSYDPTQSIAAGISIATTTFAALVYVPKTFTCSKIDVNNVSGTENVTVGLWPATAPAGAAVPLAFSAATAASAGAVLSLTFNGSSSPTSVVLTGGTPYLVTVYGSTTGVASCLTATATSANANTKSWSTTTTYRCATVGTLNGTLATNSVFGTSTLSADLVWVGLH